MNDLQSKFYSVKIQNVLFQHKGRVECHRLFGVQSYKHLTEGQYWLPTPPSPSPSPQFLIIFPNKVVIANLMQ